MIRRPGHCRCSLRRATWIETTHVFIHKERYDVVALSGERRGLKQATTSDTRIRLRVVALSGERRGLKLE